jgi:hypothetical protein
MARSSKKGAKTEAEVAAEARRKKEILGAFQDQLTTAG